MQTTTFKNMPRSLNQDRIAYASILQIQTTRSGSISSERVCFLLPKAFLLPTATLLLPLHLRSSVNFGTLYIWAVFNKPCFVLFVLFYLPYLSSIHEKANCIAILWTGSPHSLGSCLFRGLWVTCLPHKGGASR